MPMSKKKMETNNRWIKENYAQVKISVPKAEAEALDQHIKKYNYTKAGFIRQAIKDKMEDDQKQRREAADPDE